MQRMSSKNALLRRQNPGPASASRSRDTLTFNKKQLSTCDHDYKLPMSLSTPFTNTCAWTCRLQHIGVPTTKW